MLRHSLSGTWDLWYGVDDASAPSTPEQLLKSGWPRIAAQVPGNVELDLGRAGVLPEHLEVGNRVYDAEPCETYRWWYRCTFPSPPAAPPSAHTELVFEGLDCLGQVWLNGRLLGETANMLIAHRFDVSGLLRPSGANELLVRIASAVLAGRLYAHQAGEWASATNYEGLAIRKAPHCYGWDILPRLVSAGLWRDVALEISPATRFTSAYWATVRTDPELKTAEVLVDWEFTADPIRHRDLQLRLVLSRHGRVVHEHTLPVFGPCGRWRGIVRDVDLWWPRGTGEPSLYQATLELRDVHGQVLATRAERIGLRTVAVNRTALTTPEKPGEFVFLINGEKVFIKGTNWVPLDAFHSRDTQHLAAAFAMVLDLNCNMLRCWGGNIYEADRFFNLCDEQGILVWQDFAMACAVYPQTDAFAQAIRQEAQSVVLRLRNHASLALWAGNNECDDAYGWAGGGHVDPNTDRLSRQVLPEVIRTLDFLRAYLPSSPYRSPELVQAGNNDLALPEAHLWGPRDDFKGAFYTSSPAHFVSEIGYHGCPCRASLEQMFDPDHVWPWQNNDQWRTKAVRARRGFTDCDYRLPLMAKQAGLLFGQAPTALDDFVLASQVSQAEALKFFIERWRAGKWRRTGILWWNLRDGWPVISDAVVDYYHRRKLAYWFIRQSQQDLCGMVQEPDAAGNHELVLVNDQRRPQQGRIVVADQSTGKVLLEKHFAVAANSRTSVGLLPTAPSPTLWQITWHTGRTAEAPTATPEPGSHAGWNHYLAGARPFALKRYAQWLRTLPLPAEAWEFLPAAAPPQSGAPA